MILLYFLCIIQLKLKSNHNGFTYFFKRYGDDEPQIYRNLYNNILKLSKLELEIDFLQNLFICNVFPKLLRLKPYKRTVRTSNFYKSRFASYKRRLLIILLQVWTHLLRQFIWYVTQTWSLHNSILGFPNPNRDLPTLC